MCAEIDIGLLQGCRWRLHGLTSEQADRIIGEEYRARHFDFARDRLLQRLIEACDYKLLFFLISFYVRSSDTKPGPGSFQPPKPGPEHFIEICPPTYSPVVKRWLTVDKVEPPAEFAFSSAITVINVDYHRDQAEKGIARLGRSISEAVSVKEAGTVVWGHLAKNMRANIQTYMRTRVQRGKESQPIFRPRELGAERDPRGSRLDFSDTVAVGLIFTILRNGGTYSDFQGECRVVRW